MPSRKTARHLVADYLRQAILTGELGPGQKLGVGEIATMLGVSHTPIREAFQVLAGEGLVRINEYRSAQVAELSADEYEEIMLMRLPLEGLAARLGAERIDDAGIAEMRTQLAGLAEAAEGNNLDGFVDIDRAFHRAHYLASGREGLWERIISLRYAAERYTRIGYRIPGIAMDDTVRTHTELFEAVERHDGERAEELIVTDLRVAFEQIWAALKDGKGEALAKPAG